MKLHARTRTMLAWSLWLATFGCCAAGLIVTLIVSRPLTTAVLAEGALYALVFPLASATIGLVLALRRPANPSHPSPCASPSRHRGIRRRERRCRSPGPGNCGHSRGRPG